MVRALCLSVALTLLCGCLPYSSRGNARHAEVSQPAEHQIRQSLSRLYRSFSYAPGHEPDWSLMRSCFVSDAQVVLEPNQGRAPRAMPLSQMIAQWQASLREKPSNNLGYVETISSIRLQYVGAYVDADVVFYGKAPNDPRARKPGLDRLRFSNANGAWQVESLEVQYESKL